MSQTYHSLLSFWKQLHVASLLEKKYCPCSFPPPVALRRFAALPSLGSGRDGVADQAGFTSLIGWQLTSVTWHRASFEALAESGWGQKFDANSRRKKTILSSPSHLLPDCPSLVGWLKLNSGENVFLLFVTDCCNEVQIVYITFPQQYYAMECCFDVCSLGTNLPDENCHQIIVGAF